MSMYMYLLISWFFGSFLFSRSLDQSKPLNKQMLNVRIFPVLFFMVYMVTAMLVCFTGTSNIDWNNPELLYSVETFPFAIVGTYAFLVFDLMYSKVTWCILSDVGKGLKDFMRDIWIRVYCEVSPEVLKRRAEQALREQKEMGF